MPLVRQKVLTLLHRLWYCECVADERNEIVSKKAWELFEKMDPDDPQDLLLLTRGIFPPPWRPLAPT